MNEREIELDRRLENLKTALKEYVDRSAGILRDQRTQGVSVMSEAKRNECTAQPPCWPSGRFRCIVADPPWKYSARRPFGASKEFRPNSWDKTDIGAMTKYPLMTTEDICALPVASVAENDAHLYLWTTNAFMCEAHRVAEAWGFKQKTILTWCKVKPDGTPSMKMGYYFRGATEHCLFAVRGKMRLNMRTLPTAFLWPRIGQHSRKPDSFFEMVEMATPGPRLELFARRKREGWICWGNEVPCEANTGNEAR